MEKTDIWPPPQWTVTIICRLHYVLCKLMPHENNHAVTEEWHR